MYYLLEFMPSIQKVVIQVKKGYNVYDTIAILMPSYLLADSVDIQGQAYDHPSPFVSNAEKTQIEQRTHVANNMWLKNGNSPSIVDVS